MLHGNRTYLLMDDDGQIQDAHSISAGLDYPGIGPEHAWLHDVGRVTYLSATDEEALAAFQLCCKLEGIIPALEPAHALAKVIEIAPQKPKDHLMVMNLCGRGDKDIFTVAEHLSQTIELRPRNGQCGRPQRKSVASSAAEEALCSLAHPDLLRLHRMRHCRAWAYRTAGSSGQRAAWRHHRRTVRVGRRRGLRRRPSRIADGPRPPSS